MENVVVKNNIYKTKITSFGSSGEGICRINGFTVFVFGGVLEDECEVKILKVNKSYAFGKIVNLIKPSPYRTEPKCEIAEKCGGCQLMHIDYAFQLQMKKKIVSDALERIGGFPCLEVKDVYGMENPYRYRNKMQFPVSSGKEEDVVCGFFKERTHEIIPIDDCITGPEVSKRIISATKKYMHYAQILPYNEETHTGIVRHIFVRTGKSGVMVTLVCTKMPKDTDLFVKLIREECPEVSSVFVNINDKRTNLILGDKFVSLFGSATISDTLDGLVFEISAKSFYQINPKQTEVLYNTAVSFADPDENDTVFDLYCGTGTISLFMARRAKKVIGIEIVEEAIENARENAKNNNLTNLNFYAGDAGKTIDYLYETGEKADIVVFDPPRKGADELTLSTIIKMSPKKIVYVSCNPATLARDLKYLAENGGYYPKKVQPVDMFPHTYHVETVALLEKTK